MISNKTLIQRSIPMKYILNLIEIFLLTMGFFLFSSKIYFSPWFSPLTTYMLLYLLILLFVQVIYFFIIWHFCERNYKLKNLFLISLFNILQITLITFFCIFSIKYFYIMSYLLTLTNLLSTIYLVSTTYLLKRT